jgi:hypothetical protein
VLRGIPCTPKKRLQKTWKFISTILGKYYFVYFSGCGQKMAICAHGTWNRLFRYFESQSGSAKRIHTHRFEWERVEIACLMYGVTWRVEPEWYLAEIFDAIESVQIGQHLANLFNLDISTASHCSGTLHSRFRKLGNPKTRKI